MLRTTLRRRVTYLLAALALLAAAATAGLWAYDSGNDSAEAQVQVYRWVNVTVEVPEDSGLTVTRHFWDSAMRPPPSS